MASGSHSKVWRARRYVAATPAAVSGERGHDRTFRVASILVNGFDLDRDEALSVLREYNRRCQPPWSDKELTHKVDDALAADQEYQRGYMLRRCFIPYVPGTIILAES